MEDTLRTVTFGERYGALTWFEAGIVNCAFVAWLGGHASRESGSGRAGRRGTTPVMTLTRLLPAGRVRLRYGAMTAASS